MKRIIIAAVFVLIAAISAKAQVIPGIEVLRNRGYDVLQGKRIGLLTNPSGVDRELRSTIDILYNAPGVELVRLFAPEHGVRGDVYGGMYTEDETDQATGLQVVSLFGKNGSTPTKEMLDGLDAVVYDIQDIGSRSYTFISALGLMMRSCALNGVEVIVLDRPNPLGGVKIEGCCVEPGFYSYVSQFRIPYIYGLTVGEFAMFINGEGLNSGEDGQLAHVSCKLTVVPMQGWKRDMLYSDTGLPWILPSPQIPNETAAIGYPCAGITGDFARSYINIGVGYTLPFQVFGSEWIDAQKLKQNLDKCQIPGVAWRTIHYKPFFGQYQGKLLHGVQYFITDYEAAPLTLINFYVIQAVQELYPDRNPFLNPVDNENVDRVCGSDKIMKAFSKRFKVSDIQEIWDKDVDSFRKISDKYHIY